MTALVTGASSGIGRDIARTLADYGINLIITARRRDRLVKLKKELTSGYCVKVKIITADLTDDGQCFDLYCAVKKYNIDILINNAGFGVFGDFTKTDIYEELKMLNVNIRATHTLFKLFLHDFKERGNGYIMNVASSAGFFPGPHFSSYYASKAYIVRLTQAVREELFEEGSGVSVSMLCPGPVDTEFTEKANVEFLVPSQSSEYVAKYAVDKMFDKQLFICPSPVLKTGIYLGKMIPDGMTAFLMGLIQSRRKHGLSEQ